MDELTPCALDVSERAAFERIAQALEGASTIAISGHTDPDGDALGSNLALAAIIALRWPDKQVTSLLANDADVPRTYAQLPGADGLVRASSYTAAPDLFISVDTPTPERLMRSREVLERAASTVAIDHHPTMQPFADVNLLRATAASVGDVIFDFMRFLSVTPTKNIATCLLTAILTDTGRYQYQNTDAHALRASAMLVEAGASPAQIASWVYQSDTIACMHLKALVMERLALDETGRVAYSWVTRADLERLGARPEDCEGLIDVVRSVGDIDACAFLRERLDGGVRGNLRSKGELDVAAVAGRFGGGGHRAAAGLTYEGSMEDALRDVVAALADALAAGDAADTAPQTPEMPEA